MIDKFERTRMIFSCHLINITIPTLDDHHDPFQFLYVTLGRSTAIPLWVRCAACQLHADRSNLVLSAVIQGPYSRTSHEISYSSDWSR